MLYKETKDGFELWLGEPVNGVRHPPNVETLWTPAELEAVGLYKPVETPVPEGKAIVSETVARVDGVVRYVYTLTDAPPPDPNDFPLSDRQLRLGLVMSGVSLDTIETAISSIPDPIQRAVAQIWWDRSLKIEWAHPMRVQLQALVGLTDEQARAMWLMAKDLQA